MDTSFDITLTKEMRKETMHHASITWKILNFCYHACNDGRKLIVSREFQFSDASWEMIVNPNKGGTSGGLIVYLQKISPATQEIEHIVSAKVTIPRNGGEDKTCEVDKYNFKGASYKYIDMISVEEVLRKNSGYLENGTLTIKCNMTVFGEKTEYSEDENTTPLLSSCISNSLSSDFEELYENHQFSDVILKLDGEEFKAHKSVLSARSKVFAAMFAHDMKEKRLDAVDLMQMEGETVRDMLRYVYCGKIRDLSPEEALNLYVAADRYDLPELRNFCREIILLDISVNNVCDIVEVADLHEDELLIRELKTFLLKNGKEVIKTEKWKATYTNKPMLCGKMFEWAFSE